ncbi:exported hypothetical protein [Verrucomicrobia bacterium]|nr:exported hypothetical protein [Verrucomicrobiota bacterium]
MLTFILALLTFGSFLLFVSAPGRGTLAGMATLAVLLFLACRRLFVSAARVVEVQRVLRPQPRQARVAELRPDGSDWLA